MPTQRFVSAIAIRDGNPYIPITAARANAIKPDWRKPLPVLVRINDKPRTAWRINMMPAGDGRFYLYLHGHVRKASATKVGDRVRVEVGFDSTYKNGPMHPMPKWFSRALRSNATAMKNWQDGRNISKRDQTFEYAFVVEFESESELLAYLNSQEHERFVRERFRPHIEARAIVRFEAGGGATARSKEQ